MNRLALAGALALALSSSAVAAPPPPGLYTFEDKENGTTVVCDTLDQLKTIVQSEDPIAAFGAFYETSNAAGFRVCDSLWAFEAEVIETIALPNTEVLEKHFKAWAVKIDNGDGFLWALYLELMPGTTARLDARDMQRDYREFRELAAL